MILVTVFISMFVDLYTSFGLDFHFVQTQVHCYKANSAKRIALHRPVSSIFNIPKMSFFEKTRQAMYV
jgi:hypothetical protein